MTLLCTVHDVRFTSEPGANTKNEDRERARLPECPVCAQQKYNEMQKQLAMITDHRDALLKVVSISNPHIKP